MSEEGTGKEYRQPVPGRHLIMVCDQLERSYGTGDLGNLADPVDELVYISLTRQTHAKNANRSWAALVARGGSAAVLEMPLEELVNQLKPAGFAEQKARWIKKSLQMIVDRFGELSLRKAADWDDVRLESFLTSLPGINIKSAKCIMMYSMGRAVLPVDTHVRRVATRLGVLKQGASEKAAHQQLESLIPPDERYSFHVNAIWHGRKVCLARAPRCNECAFRVVCDTGSSHD